MAKSVRKYEIWMCDLGANNTMQGYRPCIIVSNEFTNTNKDCCVATIIPMTTSKTQGQLPTHIKINANEKINKLKGSSTALAEQIITINKDNIKFCLGKISSKEIGLIDKAVLVSLGYLPYIKFD